METLSTTKKNKEKNTEYGNMEYAGSCEIEIQIQIEIE